jgi:hypothetical protein
MALSFTPVFPQKPQHFEVTVVNADASNAKNVGTGGSNGTIVRSLQATSDDTSQRIVQIGISVSATFYLLGSVAVPAASGTDGSTVAVDLLNSVQMPGLPVDENGMHYLILESGEILQVKTTTTVTAAKTVTVQGFAQDY